MDEEHPYDINQLERNGYFLTYKGKIVEYWNNVYYVDGVRAYFSDIKEEHNDERIEDKMEPILDVSETPALDEEDQQTSGEDEEMAESDRGYERISRTPSNELPRELIKVDKYNGQTGSQGGEIREENETRSEQTIDVFEQFSREVGKEMIFGSILLSILLAGTAVGISVYIRKRFMKGDK